MGGTFGFDPGHGILYSSNLYAGMWRVAGALSQARIMP